MERSCKTCGLSVYRNNSSVTGWRHSETKAVACAVPGNAEPAKTYRSKDSAVDVERELYLALKDLVAGHVPYTQEICNCNVCKGFRAIKLYEQKGKS